MAQSITIGGMHFTTASIRGGSIIQSSGRGGTSMIVGGMKLETKPDGIYINDELQEEPEPGHCTRKSIGGGNTLELTTTADGTKIKMVVSGSCGYMSSTVPLGGSTAPVLIEKNNSEINESHVTIIGKGNRIVGSHCKVIGDNNTIIGSHISVVGNNNTCTGSHCKLFGNNNKCTGSHCKLIGRKNRESGTFCKVKNENPDSLMKLKREKWEHKAQEAEEERKEAIAKFEARKQARIAAKKDVKANSE